MPATSHLKATQMSTLDQYQALSSDVKAAAAALSKALAAAHASPLGVSVTVVHQPEGYAPPEPGADEVSQPRPIVFGGKPYSVDVQITLAL